MLRWRLQRGSSDESSWHRNDAGAVTAFVVVMSTALLFATGLAFDGGRMLTGWRDANELADSAARAGTQKLSDEAIRNNAEDILDHDAAVDAACNLLQQGRPGTSCSGISTAPNQVTVEFDLTVDMAMLPGVGAQTFHIEGTACVARGVSTGGC